LTNDAAYDLVWDLRYNANFTLDDLNAFRGYLANGGRIYFTGENSSFDPERIMSLRGVLFALGAGDVGYGAGVPSNTQTFTTAGAALNAPNSLAAVEYLGARQVTGGGSGFLVTESPAGTGSMVAWDFGQISGAPSSAVPEPATSVSFTFAVTVILTAACRRKQRLQVEERSYSQRMIAGIL